MRKKLENLKSTLFLEASKHVCGETTEKSAGDRRAKEKHGSEAKKKQVKDLKKNCCSKSGRSLEKKTG